MTSQRKLTALRVRKDAADLAAGRVHPKHQANGDEQRYASAHYPMNFSKGLDHDPATGLVKNSQDFEAFRTSIDNGFIEAFTTTTPVPRDKTPDKKKNKKRRKWEAPTAGLVYDLQGPDSQAVTMPPAPALCSDELTFEMAEVYELALLRDEPLHAFESTGGSGKLTAAIARLNKLQYAKDGFKAGRPRKKASTGELDRQTAFRGSSPGVEQGPYLSQFMIIGNDKAEDGLINYGAQKIDQRVIVANDKKKNKDNEHIADDYMMSWDDWYQVQQGYEVRGGKTCGGVKLGQDIIPDQSRFIYSPRDLATYVHVDQLYQAYLNACLILLGNGTPFDPSFDVLSGNAETMLYDPANGSRVDLNAGGFALWGGPHVLSLLTEVATRGLKAVRYQKFNIHLRARPEVLAARIHQADHIEKRHPSLCQCFSSMGKALHEVLEKINEHNTRHLEFNKLKQDNNASHHDNGNKKHSTKKKTDDEKPSALLPMAFEEGSPMHPAYGAGHATVAGACVTILKAFFDTSATFVRIIAKIKKNGKEMHQDKKDASAGFFSPAQIKRALECGCKVEAGSYEVLDTGKDLRFTVCGYYDLIETKKGKEDQACKEDKDSYVVFHKEDESCCPLTLEGELNKLAANISIGRNMAGVHYFSDYYDSLRMGEQVAIGILEEQALCYPTDPCVISLPTFDGEVVRIGLR